MEASETGKLELAGQVAVVSGGLGDIGRATALALRAAGATVAISDLASSAIARRAMPGFHYTRVDVTDAKASQKWIDRVARDLGSPSLIICNAGIVEVVATLETTPAQWQRTIAVNLTGAFFLAQAAAKRMVGEKRAGRIVFVGSWAGEVPHTRITTYSVAKAGLRMAMKCLAAELAGHGILVNEIAPGIVDAGLSGKLMARKPGLREKAQLKVPTRRLLSADDVAYGVLTLCAPRNQHMTGMVLTLDGGLSVRPHL